MQQQIAVITLAVADLGRSKRFYAEGERVRLRVEGESVRSRNAGLWHSLRWSMPVRNAGRSTSWRARSAVASTMA